VAGESENIFKLPQGGPSRLLVHWIFQSGVPKEQLLAKRPAKALIRPAGRQPPMLRRRPSAAEILLVLKNPDDPSASANTAHTEFLPPFATRSHERADLLG